VLWCVAVHEGEEIAHGKGDVRAGSNSNIIEGADESTVRGAGLPFSDLGWNGNTFIRALEDKSGDHWCLTGMGIREVVSIDDLVDEHCWLSSEICHHDLRRSVKQSFLAVEEAVEKISST